MDIKGGGSNLSSATSFGYAADVSKPDNGQTNYPIEK
jgi:hypothetical protein